jgi:peptidoglycan/xylan/chitin deacetylase (PgdA/CDA1 family)
MFGGVFMKSNKILITVVFIAVFALFLYQVISLGALLMQNHSAMKEEGVQTLSPDEVGIVVRNGLPNSNQVVFSCNVDWGEDVIPDMLKIFKDNDVKITFFVSGRWAKNNPELLKEMFQQGHEIQSHGYNHKLCTQNSVETTKEEILNTEAVILEILGVKTNVFAPPSGDYDQTTVELCKSLGYKMALWSADTIDWREGSTADVIKNRILKKQLNGAIVLMHPKPETVKALPDLIKEIRGRNLEIVPLYRLSY